MAKYFFIAAVAAIVVLAAVFFIPSGKISLSKGSMPDAEFTVVVYHTHYEPSTITLEQGSRVRISMLTAPGTETYHHGLTIDGYGISAAASSATAPTQINFIADKKGTFSGYCGSCLDGPFGAEAPDKRLTLVVN